MNNLQQLVLSLKDKIFKISTKKNGAKSIQQTQRNNTKTEIMQALYKDLKLVFGDSVFETTSGIMLEIENNFIADNTDSGSGAITLCIDCTIKDLDTDATAESDAYKVELAEKQKKTAEREKKKAEKIARDSKEREKKAE